VLEVQTDYRHGKSQLRVVRSSVIEIRSGDLVRKIGDREIKNRLDYELAMLDSNSRELPIAVERDGQRLAINISTGSRNYLTGTTNATSINHSSEGKSSGADQKIAAIDAGIEERLLREFGLKLEPADPAAVRSVDEPYRGGMLVVSVRNASPAAKASIQRGDILVGLLGWQTTSWDDLEYILKTPEMSNSSSPEFRIIRRSKVYFSNLELGASKLR
jgi:S1-C subfamily serine protease